jgi:sulfur carrier protein
MHVEIRINGETRSFESPLTVAALVEKLALNARGVAVEVNREIVARSTWQDRELGAGDRVEIVTFVGGG